MTGVVHEAVRRGAPQIRAVHRGHEQIAAVDFDDSGVGRPDTLIPLHVLLHGRKLPTRRHTERAGRGRSN